MQGSDRWEVVAAGERFDALHRAMADWTPATARKAAEPESAKVERDPKEYEEALRLLGFDSMPTEKELEEAVRRRRAEIRERLLLEADRHAWCEPGTREVLADLRLPHARRVRHTFRVKVAFEAVVPITAFTREEARKTLDAQARNKDGGVPYLLQEAKVSELEMTVEEEVK